MTNPNDAAKNHASAEALDALFARSTRQAEADRDARQRAVRWPSDVDGAIGAVVGRLGAHADALAAVDARIARLEAALGIIGD